ncbi:Chitinase 1 [Hypsizygus marmoreus]|uniref:chitinase n=1 Tax=Hypsizygus marmoreus TaxID=39966 RepID=A0A369KJ68_HYPMA|nr:Chitinase 1 [Hypsizygus marmoreus]
MVVLTSFKRSVICIGSFLFTAPFLEAVGFDNSRSDNLAVYYGQNSYGATHSDTANWQKTLSAYCQDDTINAIPLAFLHVFFSTGGLPEIDLASTCNSNGGNVFPGTRLARCPTLAGDIKACQARGKIVTISLGGATGSATFSSDAQARTFAETVWNLFLGGTSSTRPFADAILDGVDLDIEGGTGKGLAAFVTRIRELSNGASKRYYITAAPQCPFPDAYLGSAISAVGFDAVYVQVSPLIRPFLSPYSHSSPVDNWAKTTSPNKNIKVYIGAPAASSAAGSGYIDAATLGRIAQETRSKYSSFGGIMLWDASQAYGNGRYDVAIKNAIDDHHHETLVHVCLYKNFYIQDIIHDFQNINQDFFNDTQDLFNDIQDFFNDVQDFFNDIQDIIHDLKALFNDDHIHEILDHDLYENLFKPNFDTDARLRELCRCLKLEFIHDSHTSAPIELHTADISGLLNGGLWQMINPDTPGGGAGVWADNGACSSAGGTGAVTTSNTPAPTSGADSCSGTAAWGPGVTYVGADTFGLPNGGRKETPQAAAQAFGLTMGLVLHPLLVAGEDALGSSDTDAYDSRPLVFLSVTPRDTTGL